MTFITLLNTSQYATLYVPFFMMSLKMVTRTSRELEIQPLFSMTLHNQKKCSTHAGQPPHGCMWIRLKETTEFITDFTQKPKTLFHVSVQYFTFFKKTSSYSWKLEKEVMTIQNMCGCILCSIWEKSIIHTDFIIFCRLGIDTDACIDAQKVYLRDPKL